MGWKAFVDLKIETQNFIHEMPIKGPKKVFELTPLKKKAIGKNSFVIYFSGSES